MWEEESEQATNGLWETVGNEGRNIWNGVTQTVGKVQETVTPYIDGAVRTVSNGARDLWGSIAD
jgi:hypothetical protein